MAIPYDFFQTEEINGEKGKYRARAVSRGTINADKLAHWMQQKCGISTAEAKSFMIMLGDCMMDFLKEGYHVEVKELGHFSVSLTSDPVSRPSEIRAESIEFSRLNFRPAEIIRKTLVHTEKEMADASLRKRIKAPKPQEERAAMLRAYLQQHPFISRTDYSRLTHTNRDMAIRDLNRFISEGWIKKYGLGRTVVYLIK